MTVFISFLFTILVLKFRNTLAISSIAYLVIGVIIFFYMFIDELKAFTTPTESRPIKYFDYNIDTIILILNLLTGIFRITGSVMIMCFIRILTIEKKRNDSEKNESLIKINDCLNKDSSITFDDENLQDFKKDSNKFVKVGFNQKQIVFDENEMKMKSVRDSAMKVKFN